MKVLFLLTKRQPPSARLRIRNCVDFWRLKGLKATIVPIPSDIYGRYKLLQYSKEHDIVLIQKKTSFREFELRLLQKANPNILFDFDDAVMFHELEHHKPLSGKNFKKFIRTINYCSTVVAGNRFLARFAEANCENVHVLPTPVDINKQQLKDWDKSSNRLIIGWLGVKGNLHYLEALAPVFQGLTQKFPNLHLKIVSNDFIDIDGVNIIKERWSLEKEAEQLASFDIGLMPLKDDLWSWGKCGYKILQYFGAGVPAVASPVGINSEFINNGVNGYLASTHDEWGEALRKLLEDKIYRKKCGYNARQLIDEKYSQDNFAIKYYEIMKQMIISAEANK